MKLRGLERAFRLHWNSPESRVRAIAQLDIVLLALLTTNCSGSELSVASIFSEGMVLRRAEPAVLPE
jgi:hypothetical protein